jgi:hypothetical protein
MVVTTAGYRPQRKVYKLTFADPEMGGLVVRARGLTLGELLELSRLRDGGPEELAQMFRLFAGKLVEWNVEGDDGSPLPATYESLLSLDDDFALSIVDAWTSVTTDVQPPLGQTSNGGGPSLVASLPMEPLSSSQAS